jgi:hypothetical protein
MDAMLLGELACNSADQSPCANRHDCTAFVLLAIRHSGRSHPSDDTDRAAYAGLLFRAHIVRFARMRCGNLGRSSNGLVATSA